MGVSLTITSPSGNSSVTLCQNHDTLTLELFYLHKSISELTFSQLPSTLQLEQVTEQCISLISSTSVLFTVSASTDGSDFFDIIARNPHSHYVQLELPLGTHSWYGLGHFMNQQWPLEKMAVEFAPFYPFDNGPTGLCTLADPTLISSSGLVVKIMDPDSPCLHLGLNAPAHQNLIPHREWTTGSLNQRRDELPLVTSQFDACDSMLRVQSRALFDSPNVSHPWLESTQFHSHRAAVPQLSLKLGAAHNIREAAHLNLSNVITSGQLTPRKPPPLDFMKLPIWTTWVRYGAEINQHKVIEFANEIVLRDLPRSVLEIDDRWSTNYGDLMFDNIKFPSPGDMVHELHLLGFRVTLWVIPFANLDSNAVTNPETRRYFIHNPDGSMGTFKWWQPTEVAALDLDNDEACEWFVTNLQSLRDEYGIDGFKFDAGEASFTPKNSVLQENSRTPADYSRMWIHKVAARFELSEVRAGVQNCQSKSPMSRILDRYSTWGLKNGLASVITSTLTSGILGYPFVLPDMIGGNAYGDDRPDAELMIRWTQLNAALPAIQFSVAPWDLGKKCDELCRTALHWRQDLFWNHISNEVGVACNGFVPIIRPMWWVDQNMEMNKIDDQFMVGDNLLVAPVIEKGVKKRNVHLPCGMWRRVQLRGVAMNHNVEPIQGGVEIIANAELDDMPVYIRVEQ